MNAENCLWKQRYERLKSFLDDAEIEIRNQGLERSDRRAWDAPKTIFVSFCFDVCDTEKTATELYGEGNFDVYTLSRRSEK